MLRHRCVFILFAIFVALLYENLNAVSFSVEPSKISASYKTKSFKLPEIKVTNTNTEPIEIVVRSAPLGQDSTGSAIEGDSRYRFAIDRFIKIKPEDAEAVIPVGESFSFVPTVEIPDEYEEPNGFALIEVECVTKSAKIKAGTSGVLTTGTIGILVLLDFPQYRKNYGCQIRGVDMIKTGENEFKFVTSIENKGNYMQEFGGSVVVTDKTGNQIAKLLLKPRSILPGYYVNLYSTWTPEDVLNDEIYVEYEVGAKGLTPNKFLQGYKVNSNGKIMRLNK